MTADNVTRLGRNRRKAIEPTADGADGADKIEEAGLDLVARRVSGGTNVRQCRHPALTRRATRCTQPDSIFSYSNAEGADKVEAAGLDLVARRVSGGTNVLQCRLPALTRRATRCTQPDSIVSYSNADGADKIRRSHLFLYLARERRDRREDCCPGAPAQGYKSNDALKMNCRGSMIR